MSKMIIDVEQKPRPLQNVTSVLQQILANIAATITVPLMIGLGDHVSSAILGCGLGTLVYLLITKRKSPVILSSNFAFIGALTTAFYTGGGFIAIVLGGFLTGLVYIILSLIVKKAGTNWVDKVFPPVIIGPVVALIGLSLGDEAVRDIVTVDAYNYINEYGNVVHPYNLIGVLCGLITFFVIVICTSQKKNKTISMIPFLIGIASGYIASLVFTIIGRATGNTYFQVINFEPMIENFKDLSFSSFISVPKLALVEGIKEVINGQATLTGVSILELVVTFVPISLVGFTEHIADHENLSSVIGRDLVKGEPGLARTLLGDGLGSITGTWFGICPNTTYGEAISCVAITKNASTFTILCTALTCVGLSFFSPLIAAFRTIPSCVIGGMCLSLFGFIAVSGLKMLKGVDFEDNRNIITVSVILVVGIGSLSLQIPYHFETIGESTKVAVKFIEISSVAFALILGLATHGIVGLFDKKDKIESEKEENEK